MLLMQLLWHTPSKDKMSKFVWFLGTGEHTLEPMKPVDKLVKVADDLEVVTAKVHRSHCLCQRNFFHRLTSLGNRR